MRIDNECFIENTHIIVSVFCWRKKWVDQGLAFVPQLHLITPNPINHLVKLNPRFATTPISLFLIPSNIFSQRHFGENGPSIFIRFWVFPSNF